MAVAGSNSMGAADGPTQLGQQRQATSVAEGKSGCQGQHWESPADRAAHRGLGSLHGAQSQGSALCTEESGVRHGREGRRGSSQGRQDCRSHPRPEDSRERCRDSVRHDRAWSTRERSPSASRCSRRRSVCRERRRRDRRSASWSSDRSSQGQRCNTYGQEGQAARWDRLREDELERREEGRVGGHTNRLPRCSTPYRSRNATPTIPRRDQTGRRRRLLDTPEPYAADGRKATSRPGALAVWSLGGSLIRLLCTEEGRTEHSWVFFWKRWS
ncbi:Hypothetical predicted protein [Pelobates cultripes]|uniref:Uncharacterized protein n=1 Tax=Pelobates cultripes TaxID=61616 RepID=A0AAD1VQW4_PELCU|nr:Hypothetical predicted protein [Pelobates cultripes]